MADGTPQMDGIEGGGEGRSRLVVFAGPHKSASSTVQEFLVQYATGRPRYRKLKAFRGWRWPTLRTSRIPARKQWSRLVYQHTPGGGTEISAQLREALADAFSRAPNVAVGSEELDRFGPTPWSHRDGMAAVRDLIAWAQEENNESPLVVDLVVNYRTPRQAQWISVWKQLMSLEESLQKRKPLSYPEWICQQNDEGAKADAESQNDNGGYPKVWEYLDCVANPLGLALALHDTMSEDDGARFAGVEWRVILIDMGGVSRKKMDIAHASACDVMGLPCTDGWVRGINRTLLVNPKSRDLEGVSPRQLDELEWLLRQRDCAYRSQLLGMASTSATGGATGKHGGSHHPRVSILHQDSLWQDCAEGNSWELYHPYLNTTHLLSLMQSQFHCQSEHSSHLNLTELIQSQEKKFSAEKPIAPDGPFESEVSGGANSPNAPSSISNLVNKAEEISDLSTRNLDHNSDWIVVHALQWFMIVALFLGLFQVRRRRRDDVSAREERFR